MVSIPLCRSGDPVAVSSLYPRRPVAEKLLPFAPFFLPASGVPFYINIKLQFPLAERPIFSICTSAPSACHLPCRHQSCPVSCPTSAQLTIPGHTGSRAHTLLCLLCLQKRPLSQHLHTALPLHALSLTVNSTRSQQHQR